MSDIRQLLGELSQSKITPAVLRTLDMLVPGEWSDVTSLDAAVREYLSVTDPAEIARISERAAALWSAKPHYARAVKIFQAVDTADKLTSAAIVANQAGNTFSLLGVLDKLTPKPDTTQALDAALKMAAEVAAFATLRGLPVTSLAEAKAFPAAIGSYAKADLMRLAAWITIDGILPLGPEFMDKIVALVSKVDTSVLTGNPLFQSISSMLPGSSPDQQKGFILSTLSSGSAWIKEFVAARGITQQTLASKLGSLMSAADKGMDVLAVALDVGTNYYTHTGIQSVARVLVHDAQESLASGETVTPGEPVPSDEGSSWFKTAATVAGVGAIGTAAAVAGAGALLWKAWSSDDDDKDDAADDAPDPELDNLDDNALAAREQAVEFEARQVISGAGTDAEKQALLEKLRRQRRRLRRARRRMMRMRGGMGRGRFGGGGRGMGGGMGGGRGGGMGRGRMG